MHRVHDEQARLGALRAYGILDTARERDFDEVAELAAAVCGAPIALVSFVADGRQFFKAEVGLGVRELPLDTLACAAILEAEFLLATDARGDPRVSCNPLVRDRPDVRFYAGALLRTPEGHAIGTVAVLDTVPRDLSAVGRRTLQVLARQVVTALELRRVVATQTLAQEAGRVGTFELDIATDTVLPSAEFCRLFGLPPAPSYPAATLEAIVIRDDEGVRSSTGRRRDGTATADVEYRIRRPDDGAVRWIARRADFLRDSAGVAYRMLGTVHDVTVRKRLQGQQAALLELGDRLRAARTGAEVAVAAAEVLGRTLAASRAGYASVDAAACRVRVAGDWTQPGVASVAGRETTTPCAATSRALATGEAVVCGDIAADPTFAADAENYAEMGIAAIVAVPVMEEGELVGLLFAHDTLPRSWHADEVDLVAAMADRTGAALGKVAAEDDQRVLQDELAHRLKNTLALVQAIANQTLKQVPDRGPVEAFERRLQALGAAHDTLLKRSWSAAPLREAVAAGTASFDTARIAVDGPDVTLGPRATVSVALLLHELATNAVKYGALSVPAGTVAIGWRFEGAADPDLVLSWREAGGPPVADPVRKGFGSKLIRMGLVGTGRTETRYDPAGFNAEFRAPLAQLQQS